MELTAEEVMLISRRAPSHTAKAVALAIMDMHGQDDDGGLSYFETEDISGYLELGLRTVKKALHELIMAEVIVKPRPGPA
jgi:hypothetical protein